MLLFNRNRTNIEIVAQGKKVPTFTELVQMINMFLLTMFAWVFFRASDLDSAMRLATAMLGFSEWHEVVLITRGIVPMFPIYLFIVWFMPNTMEIFQATRAALHVEEFRDDQARPLRPAWLTFRLNARWAFACAAVFVCAWFALSNLSPFIYFQF